MSQADRVQPSGPKVPSPPPLLFWGVLLMALGQVIYVAALGISAFRLVVGQRDPELVQLVRGLLWLSGAPFSIGLLLGVADFALLLPRKRRIERNVDAPPPRGATATVVLTAYEDEAAVGPAVRDFASHALVRRVIVVDNNSRDRTALLAREAGAIVHVEERAGYGHCVYRCLQEASRYEDTDFVVLCEADRTFRAFDLEKLLAYASHAEIVNGTRIAEQLRAYDTQLTPFMFYANFIGGKLLELKHFGRGTLTDLGTTYKLLRPETGRRLLALLDPAVNLEFNAHLLDRALGAGITVVECPITFHARVGVSKGGNASTWRAVRVGFRMFVGMTFGWGWVR